MQVTLRAKSNLVRVNEKDNSRGYCGSCMRMVELERVIGPQGKEPGLRCKECGAIVRRPALENDKTWPKDYTCNFLEAGIVSYEDSGAGIALLKKETIDSMLPSFIGKPVLIEHKDVNPKNYKQNAVGYVTDAVFNANTGWFDCKFILTDDRAKDLVAQGYSVSCSFDVLETKQGGDWHAIKYNEEISRGEFQHLALVTTPRYEDCRIMVNSKKAKIKEEGMSKKNGLDIMSPLQRDKYFESLSDSGVQSLIDDPEEDKEIKKLAEQHQAMRKQQKEEALLEGKPQAGKDKKNSMIDAKEAFVKVGEEEISVEALIERNNALQAENKTLKANDKDNKKVCNKCNVCHEGECKPEDVAKKNEVAGAKPGECEPKANEFPPKKEEEEEGKIKKNAQHFVKLNALKENAEAVTTTMVDTLHNKLERGNSRYGTKK